MRRQGRNGIASSMVFSLCLLFLVESQVRVWYSIEPQDSPLGVLSYNMLDADDLYKGKRDTSDANEQRQAHNTPSSIRR